jgi:hypothetical protein
VIGDPKFVTVLADYDGFARWLCHMDGTDIMAAYRQGGVHLLVTLSPDGEITLATKPGREWSCSWAPPTTAERA